MFSRCPHCDNQQQVTTQQLRDSRGLLNCTACGQAFDALPTLSENADELARPRRALELAPEPAGPAKSPWAWRTGSLGMLAVLMAQIVYFDGSRLLRMPAVHASLANACRVLDCRPPVANDPEQWALSHSDLEAHLDHRYLLKAALTNQAEITQSFPALKLTVTDFNGRVLAERIFASRQYAADRTLPPNETVQVRLPFVFSAGEVGGFTLSLL